ncbi:AVAST type 2 anti-phage system protein Avs2 [Nitrospira sp. Nam80]
MNSEWHKLRSWNGSQDNAFEELCCQLAASEKYSDGSEFVRKAAPDAGVECYWKFPSGEELAWQAKFFTTVPTSSQWKQLDESVSTALQKHPSLVQYTICLPLNREDPRIEKQSWFKDKWDERVRKWTEWASDRNMSVEFRYWGDTELFLKLSKVEHSGRKYFWFNKEHLGSEWFQAALEKALANAGARYTPELHINLPISQIFDGLGRTKSFYDRFISLIAEIEKQHKTAASHSESELECFGQLQAIIEQLTTIRLRLSYPDSRSLELEKVLSLCKEASHIVNACSRQLTQLDKEYDTSTKGKSDPVNRELRERRSYRRHVLSNLSEALYQCNEFTIANEALLANRPNLLIVGEAGTGKTHLFCDVAKRRMNEGLPSIVLLGGHFQKGEPWNQIIKELGLTCSNDEELLGALDAAGQATGSRTLLFIDALNEGDGAWLWPQYLGGILTTLARFPHVGIAVSVRSSYEKLVIPHDLNRRFIREVHTGFADREYDATGKFFDHFHIQRPSIPVLTPEFRNPLFLKIFCKGLSNRALHSIPEGLDGISAVFDFFIDSINFKLAGPDYLNCDPGGKYVQKAVFKLSEEMAQKRRNWITRDDARDMINAILPRPDHSKSLFHDLISEGLLSEDVMYLTDGAPLNAEEVVRFSYERFSDHLITSFLLQKSLDVINPSSCFSSGGSLYEFVKDENATWQYRGLIEALSIQIPEKTGKELIEFVKRIKTFEPVQDAFLESLLWRKPKDIGSGALQYVNDTIIHTQRFSDRFIETLLTVAPKPDHPFNAKFLHRNLKDKKLAERDAEWSIFLHRRYNSNSAVDRLLEWASSSSAKTYVTEEALHLFAIALTWFLSSSNRFLRDRATKALVNLLQDRFKVLISIIQEFADVNDPYVIERSFAVAYGCSLRSNDRQAIRELAQLTFDRIFSSGSPPPHILLRDYARGIIEVALSAGLPLSIQSNIIRPPYKSEWIPPSSTREQLEAKYYPKDWKENRGFGDIWSSVMGFGDFARYIIGTNSNHFEWTSRKLGERKRPSRKELYNRFENSLRGNAEKALASYISARSALDIYRHTKDTASELRQYSESELEAHVSAAETNLKSHLTRAQINKFHDVVLPYLSNPYRDEHAFDLSLAQRWIFEKVVQLGWTPELFGDFDAAMSHFSRNPDKAERIGKKYQWIAYHEFLARIADNFEYLSDTWREKTRTYQGPWQHYWRDIDPSLLVPPVAKEETRLDTCWWAPDTFDWQTDLDDITWLKSWNEMPDIHDLIRVSNPADGTRWLNLNGFFTRIQPAPLDEGTYEKERRNWHIILISYLVRRRDAKAVFQWATKQNFLGLWMPQPPELTQIFLGEYPWGPSFQYKNIPYFSHSGWTRGARMGSAKIPRPILVTSEEYLWERGYDCSIEQTVRVKMPGKAVVDDMNLHWTGFPGHFADDTGRIVSRDPSIIAKGPSALLVSEELFFSYLKEREYEILWTVLAEKNLIGGSHRAEDWKGRLELNGAFRTNAGEVEGELNTSFISRG